MIERTAPFTHKPFFIGFTSFSFIAADCQLSEFLRFLCVIKYRITSSLEKVKNISGLFPFVAVLFWLLTKLLGGDNIAKDKSEKKLSYVRVGHPLPKLPIFLNQRRIK